MESLSDLDRRILSTIGVRISLHIDGSEAWAPADARSVTWVANRSRLAASCVVGRLMDLAARGLVAIREVGGVARLWRLTTAGCEALGAAPTVEKPAPAPGNARAELSELRAALIAIGEALGNLLDNLNLGGADRWELSRHLEALRARDVGLGREG